MHNDCLNQEIEGLKSELVKKEAELQQLKSEANQRVQRNSPLTPAGRAGPGICDRTPEIQYAIIQALDIPSCRLIDAQELFRVRGLSSLHLLSVQPHDFADLPNLLELSIKMCSAERLPKELFDDLLSLERLYLRVRDRRYIHLETLEMLESRTMETLEIREAEYDSC